jgi:hypothetical protein
MFSMCFNQSQLDEAVANSVSKRAWAATERANALTNNLLTTNCSPARPNPSAILPMQASLSFNYGAENKVSGVFDRPLRNKKRQPFDLDDDDDDDTEENRGEGLHSFDSTAQGSSGGYPNPQYGPMPPVRSVTTEKTSKRVVEWHPGEPNEEAMAKGVGRQVTPDGRIIGPLTPMKIEDLPPADDHDPAHLFDLEKPKAKKAAHLVGNQQHQAYVQNRAARIEETGALGLPNCMAEIVATRLRECPKLRQ